MAAFWVVFAILLGGGLFGVVGMIVGVPTFAVIYYIVKLFIAQRLEEKKLPTTTSSYDGVNYVDDDGNYVIAQSKDMAEKSKRNDDFMEDENMVEEKKEE